MKSILDEILDELRIPQPPPRFPSDEALSKQVEEERYHRLLAIEHSRMADGCDREILRMVKSMESKLTTTPDHA